MHVAIGPMVSMHKNYYLIVILLCNSVTEIITFVCSQFKFQSNPSGICSLLLASPDEQCKEAALAGIAGILYGRVFRVHCRAPPWCASHPGCGFFFSFGFWILSLAAVSHILQLPLSLPLYRCQGKKKNLPGSSTLFLLLNQLKHCLSLALPGQRDLSVCWDRVSLYSPGCT